MKHENIFSKNIKLIAVTAAVVMVLSSALVFSGCGNKKASAIAALKPTTAPTVAATAAQKATQTNTRKAQAQDVQAQDDQSNDDQSYDVQSDAQSDDGSDSSSHSINDVWYAGISEQAAGQKALEQFDSNSIITSREAGTYDGEECWIVYVTENSSGRTFICYVSGDFCNVVEGASYTIDDNYYANISEQAAGQKAIAAWGGTDTDGIQIVSSNAGFYQGEEAWVVHMTKPDGSSTLAYVGGDFCYFN